MKVIFASKAEPGKKYLTKMNYPVEVVSVAENMYVVVKSLCNGGKTVRMDFSEILRSYDARRINPEALLGMSANASADKKERLQKAIARVDGRRMIKRVYKGIEYEMAVRSDGFFVKGQLCSSLTAAAQLVTGTGITTGPKFWGFAK